MNQGAYDKSCPEIFQSMEYGLNHGYVDVVVPTSELEATTWQVLSVLKTGSCSGSVPIPQAPSGPAWDLASADFTKARNLDRVDSNDIVAQMCPRYLELGGDGHGPSGLDKCLRCGLATLKSGRSIVVVKCAKGHTPVEREKFNHAMPP